MSSALEEERWILRLFVEKADKLYRLRFTKQLLEGGRIAIHGAQQPGRFVVDYVGPDEEAIDAFLFTLRFFVQDNEPTSLRRIEDLFRSLPLEQARIDAVIGSRQRLNEHLDKLTNITFRTERLQRRHIFDVFLWGGLAHANRRKKTIYDDWRASSGFPVLQAEFAATLVELLNGILWFRNALLAALQILEKE